MADRATGTTATAARRSRSFGPTVLTGLAGAAVATAAATRVWAEATTRETGLRTVAAEGADVAPAVLPLALVALAVWGTVLVLRRRGRRVVAVLGVLAAGAAGVTALLAAPTSADVARELLGDAGQVSTTTTAWPYLAVAGCLVSALASVVTFLQAPRWPEMSSRYDAPGDGPPGTTTTDMWKALDAGQDPTA
jgi:uncharacterized membrane protein (TIGR02234 family)